MKIKILEKDNKLSITPEDMIEAYELGMVAGKIKPLFSNYANPEEGAILFDCVCWDLKKFININLGKLIRESR